MSEITIEIEGLDKLGINIEKYNKKVQEHIDNAVQVGALKILRDAKIFVQVDTGRLRNSIRYSKTGEGEAEVKTNVEYAVFVEFGTSKQHEYPFMRPAAEINAPEIISAIKEAVKNAKP